MTNTHQTVSTLGVAETQRLLTSELQQFRSLHTALRFGDDNVEGIDHSTKNVFDLFFNPPTTDCESNE